MFKTSLQKLVLLLNRVPFALFITRLPYYAAVKACKTLMARHPAIQAAYARNSFALGTWVPGRSDIDLTVTWQNPTVEDLPNGMTELDVLGDWWRDYGKLQRWYPMLGEVEMIHSDHLLASTRFGLTGFEATLWLPIYGSIAPQSGYCGDKVQYNGDRLSYAISVYHHQMHGAVKSASTMTLQRYAKKIWRYLDLPIDGERERKFRSLSAMELEILVIQALAQRAIATVEDLKSLEQPVCLQTLLQRDVINQIETSTLPLNHPILTILEQPELATDLVSVFPASNYPNKVYYVVRDNISDISLKTYLFALQGRAEDALVIPQSLLICLFYNVDIFEYLALLPRRTVLWGSEPFLDWPSLPRSVLNVSVGISAGYIFSLPYQLGFNDISEQTFKNFLFGWILRIGRFLEDGVMDFDYKRLHNYWNQNHPEFSEDLELIDQDTGDRFDLLCRLNNHLSERLLNLN